MLKIILASASPRRRELLEQAGYQFEVLPAGGEEVVTSTHPAEVVQELSLQKARQAAARVFAEDAADSAAASGSEENPEGGSEGSCLIIGADTVVAAGHRILGKPADRAEAEAMIRLLQGRRHQVYTGVTLLLRDTDKKIHIRTFYECTDVDVYDMTSEEIKDYTATPEPYDKAGAYGIQGGFGVFIKGIHGCYYNVVGLPIARLRREIRAFVKDQ